MNSDPATPPSAPEAPTPTPAIPAPPTRRRLPGLLLWLLLLVVLGALGWGGRELWTFREDMLDTVEGQQRLMERLSRQLAGVQVEVGEAEGRRGELAQAQQRLGVELAALASRLEESQQGVAELQDSVQGGRRRFQVLAVEQLLLAANDRLQLARDPATAQRALELAEARLAQLAEPALFKVREAIAAERAALAAVPRADIGTLALTLGSLVARADQLPLAAQIPGSPPRGQPPVASAPDGSWPARVWNKVRQALAQIFVVRRAEQGIAHLLPAEQQALVRQIFRLRLETARFALLAREGASFKQAVQQAEAWLQDYYKAEDAAVLAARADLERLAQQPLDPPLPELSRSLSLLRAYLESAPR